MKRLYILGALAALMCTSATGATTQAHVDRLAANLGVRLEILDNGPDKCPPKANGCFLSELQLRMPRDLPPELSAGDFEIYFSSVAPVLQLDSDAFNVRHINGDLHVLRPRAGVRLRAGGTYRMKLWSAGHFFSAYYPMPNMYLVSGNLAARTIAATRPVIDPASGLERLPFVAPMTNEDRLGRVDDADDTRWMTPERSFVQNAERSAAPTPAPEFVILPTPALVQRAAGPALDLRSGVSLSLSGVARPQLAPALQGLAAAGVSRLDRGPQLRISLGRSGARGSYRLSTANRGIRIDARDAEGASNALRSLAQQVAYEGGRLRPLRIEDSPRFGFRGLHIDIGRNFHSKQELLKVMEQMSVYKLNKLHLHMGEDEAWRLEIKSLPELTQVGAFRCHDPSETVCLLPQLGAGAERNSPVNGFLSQADYRQLLAAAKARHIEIIPSFDMPGHSRAAIRSMEARYRRLMALGRPADAERYRLVEPADTTKYLSVQNYTDNTLNVCLESTYRFVDTVIDEVAAMHAAAGTPLRTYHIGADETAGAWTDSPACKAVMARTGRTPVQLGAMFIERVAASLAKKKISAAGWSDGMGHTDPAKMPANVQSNIWSDLFSTGPAEAHRHANNGWQAVISMPQVVYFDVPYAPHPLERGLDWPTRWSDTFKVFSFMPENLPANASVMTDMRNKPTTVGDTEPLQSGRRMAGLQAQLWSELVRNDSLVDYMLFPRIIALAERAWRRPEWEPAYRAGASYSFGDGKVNQAQLRSEWQSFATRVRAQLPQLERAGVAYRIAPPGARIVDGRLEANTEFPGQRVEFRPRRAAWTVYSGPVRVRGPVELRTRSADGRRVSRTVEVAP